MEVGEEEEAWIISMPLIDLGCFAEDELRKLAVCTNRSLQDSEQHIPVPKINRAVFNESAGSKRQTYRTWELLKQESNPQEWAAAPSTTGVSSSFVRKMSTTILHSSPNQQETGSKSKLNNVAKLSTSIERENGHQCKLDQKHQGLQRGGGRADLQGVMQVETTLLQGEKVAAGRDSGLVHLNGGEGAAAAATGQKRRQPNHANDHHGGGAGAHNLHQLQKSWKSMQNLSPGEEHHHASKLVPERVAHSSAELSVAGMMSMGHPAASLGQQNAESEPELYAEMIKQQLKRKSGKLMTANMDGKVVHAQGFPKGWTVSVGLRHKTGKVFYKYKQWKSPDGKIWGSFMEAAAHMVCMLQQEHFFNVIAPPRPSCPVCEQSDPSLIHLTHCCPTRDPEWACKVCDRIFSNSEALQIHQSAHASNQVLDPLKAITSSRNLSEVDSASTPETYPVCGKGGPCSSSNSSCHSHTTTDPRWICKICECVYSNSEALRIHVNGHALASQMLNSKRLITDSKLQNRSCKEHGKNLSVCIPQEQRESETKKEGDKICRNLTNKADGLTTRESLKGRMDASQNHQGRLLPQLPFGSREECLCCLCDEEQQKASPRSKYFGSSQHFSSFSCTHVLCNDNLHTNTDVAPANSMDPIYEENPGIADISNSSDASNYSDEQPKGNHGIQTASDENGTHVGVYPKLQSTTEAEHGGFESSTCHELFHKASLFDDHLASFKTRRRKKPTQVPYGSKIMGAIETSRTNLDQSKTPPETRNPEAKLENELASMKGQPTHEIFRRMIQNSAHVGSNGTRTSNATLTSFLEKEKVEDMRHGMKAEIFEDNEAQELSAAHTQLQQTSNTNVCTESESIHTVLNMQSQYSSDEGGAEHDEHYEDDDYQSPAQSPYEEGDCNVCGTHEKDAPEQVYCDCCGAGFHWTCVTSEPQPVPEGSWMCPDCENEHF